MLCYYSSTLVALPLLLTAVLTDINVQAQEVIFRDEINRCPNGDCLHIRECPSVLRTFREKLPAICRFEGLTPIVCCPNPTEVTPIPLQEDIHPPNINFECGKSAEKVIRDPFEFAPFVLRRKRQVVRPDAPSVIVSPFPFLESLNSSGFFQPTVVGGLESRRNAWPWMALLGNRNRNGNIDWFCAGALINEQWVLSAAHCFHTFEPNVIRLAEHDYSSNTDGANHEDFDVAEVIRHPDYTRRQAYHDLALIRLTTAVTVQEFIRPVCLPWGDESNKNITGRTVTLTGWGTTEFGGLPSPTLQEAKLTVFSASHCDRSYRTLIGFEQSWPRGIGAESLCVGYPEGGRDACQGDSGGPIVSNDSPGGPYTVAGIVSRGYGCGLASYPGLYANVRHKPYLAWIKKTAF